MSNSVHKTLRVFFVSMAVAMFLSAIIPSCEKSSTDDSEAIAFRDNIILSLKSSISSRDSAISSMVLEITNLKKREKILSDDVNTILESKFKHLPKADRDSIKSKALQDLIQ